MRSDYHHLTSFWTTTAKSKRRTWNHDPYLWRVVHQLEQVLVLGGRIVVNDDADRHSSFVASFFRTAGRWSAERSELGHVLLTSIAFTRQFNETKWNLSTETGDMTQKSVAAINNVVCEVTIMRSSGLHFNLLPFWVILHKLSFSARVRLVKWTAAVLFEILLYFLSAWTWYFRILVGLSGRWTWLTSLLVIHGYVSTPSIINETHDETTSSDKSTGTSPKVKALRVSN